MVVRIWSIKTNTLLMAQLLWKQFDSFIYKVKQTLNIQYHLGIHPREIKTCPHKNTHMDFYSSFIQKCQNLEATKTSLLDEWINCGTPKQWGITQCFKEHLLSCKKTWKKLKCVLLSERNQSEKSTHCMSPKTWCSWKRQNHGVV